MRWTTGLTELWRRYVPFKFQYLVRCAADVEDLRSSARFLFDFSLPAGFAVRARYLRTIYGISARIDCAHKQSEILECVTALMRFRGNPQAVFVEAGCYKGGSTAKFSAAASLVGRDVVAFDSFEGLPANEEVHGATILGETPCFDEGRYRGELEEVQANVRAFGAPGSCRFVKGWFDQTMLDFNRPIAAAYLDVDLVSSTKTCIKSLYPLLEPGGSIFSQDAHLPLIIALLGDETFWRDEVRCAPPAMAGLGSRKLVRMTKPRGLPAAANLQCP